MPTIRDVARRAGVSIATASKIVNKKGKYSEETKKRVRSAVEELGYTVNRTARSLKTGITGTIGMVVKEYHLLRSPQLLFTAISMLSSQSFSVELILNREPDVCKQLLDEGRFDGLLIIDMDREDISLKNLIESRCNFVLLDGDVEREDVNLVEIDYFQGGYLATKHLIGLGHHEILFAEDNEDLSFTQEIKRGYLFALDEEGLQYNQLLMHSGDLKASHSRESVGYAAVESTIHQSSFSAILSTEDRIIFGAQKALCEHGLAIPADVSVIGFGNTNSSEYLSPPLTTLEAPFSQMGELGAEILVNNIKRRDAIVKRVKLNTRLIQRQTTAKKLT